ncbi:MAG: c-type cytochrome, partial [Planctomycetota bacterium]
MLLLRRCVWTSVVLLLAAGSAGAMDDPHWIWAGGDRDGAAAVALRTTFQEPDNSPTVELWLANAYCDCEIFLNGESIHRLRPFQPPSRLDIAPLRSGENELIFICRGVEGPSALAARLDIGKTSFVTDTAWQVTELPEHLRSAWRRTVDWVPATSYGTLDQRAWISAGVATTVVDDYTQWKRALEQKGSTAADQLEVQPGFEVERLYSAGAGEGSWISLAEDPQGRWVIGHEDAGLVRITLREDGRNELEKIEFPARECRGLLFAHDSLYAMGNNSLALFRLRDTNNDDQFDKIEQVKTFAGGVGHGRNQLTLGPDGKVYAIFGDSVQQPADAEYLPPLIPHPDDIQKTQNGFVARTDAQGENWEVVARGLRNPYGLDFNRHGDLFTYDADAEYDMGSSWYRPTRVLHLLPGGDYGWRSVTQRWPPYDPDSATTPQPTLDIGRGSPTAVEFASGDKFPPAYREALFALDWSYGRILAVHLQPCGSSYAGAAEVFLRGSPLNVTDIEFGRDGAMYFVTGGRQTQSGLYRVRYVGDELAAPEPTPQQIAVARHADVARQQRRHLESLRGDQSPETLATAWQHLDAADPWIRHAARTVVESLPVAMWRERALEETSVDRFLSAALALERFGDEADRAAMRERLATLGVHHLLPWQQVEWADLSLRQLATADARDAKWDLMFDELRSIFPANHFPLDQQTSLLLARRDDGSLVPQAMNLLEQSCVSGNQRQQMHWLFVLSTQSKGWTPALRERYFTALSDMDTFEAGEGMPAFRRLIRDAALANVPEESRDAWKKWLDEKVIERLPELPPARTTIVKQWTTADFQDLQHELAEQPDVQRGKQMFATARCVVCHRVGAEGGVSGPDLTGVARRFAPRDLLASILDPSAVVAEKYANTTFELADGRVLSGRTLVTDYRSPDAQLIPDLLTPNKTISFSKQAIVERRVSAASPMPKGLVD